MELLEKSLAMSVRVDARDLATISRKLSLTAGPGVSLTRSGVVGTVMSMVASSLAANEPELQVDSMEEAWQTLRELGLAPRSQQHKQVMARALQVDNQDLDAAEVGKKLTRHFAGRGLSQEESQGLVRSELGELSRHRREQAVKPEKSLERELAEQAAREMLRRGFDPVEVEQRKELAIAEQEEQALAERQAEQAAKAARQAEQIKQATLALKTSKEQQAQKQQAKTPEQIKQAALEKFRRNFLQALPTPSFNMEKHVKWLKDLLGQLAGNYGCQTEPGEAASLIEEWLSGAASEAENDQLCSENEQS